MADPKMTREQFIAKYGDVFVADDKGGNAASEVAGQNVGEYYDTYLGPNAITSRHEGYSNALGDYIETPIQWGAGKDRTTGEQVTLDAWSNVDPHPESNHKDGWTEAWENVIRPAASIAAVAYGGWALGNALGAGTAATGVGGSAGIGSGTVLGGAAAAPASGLAGTLGMNAGYAATALNAGALNTGVSLASGKNLEDSLKSGLTAAALSGVGGWASTGIKGATAGLGGTVSNALAATGSGALTGAVGAALNGQDIGKGALTGITTGAISEASKYMGGWAKEATGSADVGKAVSTVSNTLLKGGDIGTGLLNAGANYAGNQASDAVGGGYVGDIASAVTKSAVTGKNLSKKSLLSSFSNTYSKNNKLNLNDNFA